MTTLRVPGLVSVTLTQHGEQMVFTHCGADVSESPPRALTTPGVPHSAFDTPVHFGLPLHAAFGWSGRESVMLTRSGVRLRPRFVLRAVDERTGRVVVTQECEIACAVLETEFEAHESGVLRIRHRLTNRGSADLGIERLEVAIPVRGEEMLDATGRWCRERHPQRADVRQGTWVRTSRHGRTGHDAATLTMVGERGFGDRHGSVTAAHFAYSGDHEVAVDMTEHGYLALSAGVLLQPGELSLAPEAAYETPWLMVAHSARGIDGVSEALHSWFRARPGHPAQPRPVTLNVWEAVYFDHRLESLLDLARRAADLGVERFVLDDGWFLGRRNDTAGLGDWRVDEEVWPSGLTPLIEEVRGLGMEFGLWVEPEMVNLDSRLAREHPDWIVRSHGEASLPFRQQYVLDLTNPEAFEYVLSAIDTLLRDHDIAYLKWDQNRDETAFVSAGRPSALAQTRAAYALFDALRVRHPRVEIESCSSGGGRVDAEILERTDRVWASDCNDALERVTIQRWTEALLPPELMGAHVGPSRAHTTGRTHDIAFRAAVALGGHFGIEWDIRGASDDDLRVLRAAIGLYREHRALLHGGCVAHAAEQQLAIRGVIGDDHAIFTLVQRASDPTTLPLSARLPGLAASDHWTIEVVLSSSELGGRELPAWWPGPVSATGAALAEIGVRLPALMPETAVVLLATRSIR